jgi:hypothetical protein
MKYMLLIFDEKTAIDLTPEEGAAMYAFYDDASETENLVSHQALEPARTASVVSVRDGKRIVTDGPFVETKEQLGGFFVFDCESLEAALAIAAKIPRAASGHVEVRAVHEV